MGETELISGSGDFAGFILIDVAAQDGEQRFFIEAF